MLRHQLTSSAIIILLFTGSANAGDAISAFGVTDLSYGKYIQDITTNAAAKSAYSWWIAGFVTGTNLARGRAINTDSPAHEEWIKRYCQDNPLDTFIKAAIELNKALDKRQY
jgi:hypothetical protein